MSSILDRVAYASSGPSYGRFRPKTLPEFLALRIATRLGECGAAQHYADLTERYSLDQLLIAYRRQLVRMHRMWRNAFTWNSTA
jgi:hypothetical protein